MEGERKKKGKMYFDVVKVLLFLYMGYTNLEICKIFFLIGHSGSCSPERELNLLLYYLIIHS